MEHCGGKSFSLIPTHRQLFQCISFSVFITWITASGHLVFRTELYWNRSVINRKWLMLFGELFRSLTDTCTISFSVHLLMIISFCSFGTLTDLWSLNGWLNYSQIWTTILHAQNYLANRKRESRGNVTKEFRN